jgi:shikimate kinase
MNHIVIIGFMGSGKTQVGKCLSRDLNLPFIDVDKVIIKKMDMPIQDIYDRFGEPFYRALETMTVKALVEDKEQKIISLGSGLPIQEQNQKYLTQLGTVVYLKGTAETFRKRLEGRKSLMLDGEGSQEEKIKRLLKQRDPVYAKFADITVPTGVREVKEVAKEIEEKLKDFHK